MTSFNNAALLQPGFVWSAVMALPIFIAAWAVSPDILDRFFPTKKNRIENFAWLVGAVMICHIIFNYGNWNVVRDGATLLPYLNAVCLFLLARDFMTRLYLSNPRMPKRWQKLDQRIKYGVKLGFLIAGIAVLAVSSAREWHFAALQISAALFGIASGYFGRRPFPPMSQMIFATSVLTVGITMQPEYFRFGQLGQLGVAHLAALALTVMLAALSFAFCNFANTGFVRDNHYKYIKWFMRFSSILGATLFIMTEAVPALLMTWASVFVLAWFAVKHAPKGTKLSSLAVNLWALMLMMFGIVGVMPVITVAGILAWDGGGVKKFWQGFCAVMK